MEDLSYERSWTTDAASARESEAVALMRLGQGAEGIIMRHWVAETKLNSERLAGQKEAIELVLSSKGWMSRLQCYAGTHKMLVLHRLRSPAQPLDPRIGPRIRCFGVTGEIAQNA